MQNELKVKQHQATNLMFSSVSALEANSNSDGQNHELHIVVCKLQQKGARRREGSEGKQLKGGTRAEEDKERRGKRKGMQKEKRDNTTANDRSQLRRSFVFAIKEMEMERREGHKSKLTKIKDLSLSAGACHDSLFPHEALDLL